VSSSIQEYGILRPLVWDGVWERLNARSGGLQEWGMTEANSVDEQVDGIIWDPPGSFSLSMVSAPSSTARKSWSQEYGPEGTVSSQTVPAPPEEYEWDCNGKHIIRTRGDRGTNIVVTSSDLKVYANEQLTLKQVAERRNMCLTSLKNLVKKLGIKDWREFKKSMGTNGLP